MSLDKELLNGAAADIVLRLAVPQCFHQQLKHRQHNTLVTLYARNKIRLNSLELQGEKNVIPSGGFSFLCSSQGAGTFIFPVTLSLHSFFNPPADTSAHVPEAPISSTVDINLTAYHFRAWHFNSFSPIN